MSCNPNTTNKTKSKTESDIIGKLNQQFEINDLAGIGITVISDETLMLNYGFGAADIQNKQKYTSQTIQPIGSISKLFIGVAIIRGIEFGYFELDSEINEILPFEINNPNHPDIPITIKDLATHTSSITDSDLYWENCYYTTEKSPYNKAWEHLDSVFLLNRGETPTLKTLIHNYFKTDGSWYAKDNFLNAKPGEQMEYSNVASSLAAYLVEYKSGVSFSEFTKRYIFEPLNMKNTAWFDDELEASSLATLYFDKENPFPRYSSPSYPDGALRTTITDLSIFLSTMMAGYQGKSIFLTEESFELMFKKQFDTLPKGMKEGSNSGVFWDYMPNGLLGHNGSDPGLFTIMAFDPETMEGTIYLLNHNIITSENPKTLFGQFQEIINDVKTFKKNQKVE